MKQQDKQALLRYREKLGLIRSGNDININETKAEQLARIEKTTKDFRFMVKIFFPHYAESITPDFHISLAKKVKGDKVCRVLVRWGRGLAKSVVCNILIPFWLWLNGENVYLVIVGNNQDKADLLLSDIQAEFEANPQIIHDFGDQKLTGSWSEGDFNTKDGRFRGKSIGMGVSPRGLRVQSQRPNLIVCDDLEDKDTSRNPKRQDDVVLWIERDLLPTMDGETRRYLHPNNDPWPRSIQNELEGKHPTWKVHEVKAYDPVSYVPAWKEKYDNNYYKVVEEDLGAIAAKAEYNNEPHIEGKIFTDEMIQWAKPPRIDHFKIIVGFWDPAYSGKNDYNSVKVWALKERNFWHLKAFCSQCIMAEAIKFMYDYEDSLPAGVIVHWKVEEQFWNQPVKDALYEVEQEKGRPLNIVVVARRPGAKYDKILTLHPYFQNGRLYHNINEYGNNGMKEGISQLKGIEPGYRTHDDGPDADEQAIFELSKYVQSRNFEPKITGIEEMRSHSTNRF